MKNHFVPRRLADGRICCSSETALCDTCKAAHEASDPPDSYTKSEWADEFGRQLQGYGSVVAETPDPYEPGLAKLRATAAPDPWLPAMAAFRQSFYEMVTTSRVAALAPATNHAHLVPPDGYQIALDKMKEAR